MCKSNAFMYHRERSVPSFTDSICLLNLWVRVTGRPHRTCDDPVLAHPQSWPRRPPDDQRTSFWCKQERRNLCILLYQVFEKCINLLYFIFPDYILVILLLWILHVLKKTYEVIMNSIESVLNHYLTCTESQWKASAENVLEKLSGRDAEPFRPSEN